MPAASTSISMPEGCSISHSSSCFLPCCLTAWLSAFADPRPNLTTRKLPGVLAGFVWTLLAAACRSAVARRRVQCEEGLCTTTADRGSSSALKPPMAIARHERDACPASKIVNL